MKILIRYDGSESADAALEDLKQAGLPRGAEAVVLSVADVFLPPPVEEGVDDAFPLYVPAGVKRAHAHAARVLGEASARAERLLMGSVSAAVAARAHCSVEVVRPAGPGDG